MSVPHRKRIVERGVRVEHKFETYLEHGRKHLEHGRIIPQVRLSTLETNFEHHRAQSSTFEIYREHGRKKTDCPRVIRNPKDKILSNFTDFGEKN